MTVVVDILKIRLLKMKNPKNSYNSGGEKKRNVEKLRITLLHDSAQRNNHGQET